MFEAMAVSFGVTIGVALALLAVAVFCTFCSLLVVILERMLP